MKPLKLYTRTTLMTTAVLATVLLLMVFFIVTRIRDLEQQDQQRNAKLLATQLANLLAYDLPWEISKMRQRATSFSEAHPGSIRQIRVYGVTRNGLLREEISLSTDPPEEIVEADQIGRAHV